MTTLLEETLQQGEMIGIAVALVILLVVFGAAVAAGLPDRRSRCSRSSWRRAPRRSSAT